MVYQSLSGRRLAVSISEQLLIVHAACLHVSEDSRYWAKITQLLKEDVDSVAKWVCLVLFDVYSHQSGVLVTVFCDMYWSELVVRIKYGGAWVKSPALRKPKNPSIKVAHSICESGRASFVGVCE